MSQINIHFTKMQGTGNDFVIIDGTYKSFSFTSEQIRYLCDRHFGIGADQVLLVEKSTLPGVDFRYRIFNANGSEVENCGNGARCFAKFVRDIALTKKKIITVEIARGLITLKVHDDGKISVDMGFPIFEPSQIPFNCTGLIPRKEYDADIWSLPIEEGILEVSVLSIGNPHAIQVVDSVKQVPITELGPKIEEHRCFPERVNVGFLEIIDRHSAALRVYERGVGETLACGTGACAASISGIQRNLLDSPVTIHMHGGLLTVSWNNHIPKSSVIMTGLATKVFEGQISIPS